MSFYWLGTRAREGICLSNWFPIKRGFILEDAQAPFPCHSVERTIGEKRNWGCDDLTHPVLADLFSKHAEKRDYPVLTYRPARPQDPHYNQAAWKISSDLDDLFSNKWRTRKWLSEYGLPVAPFRKIKNEKDFDGLYGTWVLQKLYGSAGRSTYIGRIANLSENFKQFEWEKGLISPYVIGPVINVNAVIYTNGNFEIGFPSIQRVKFKQKNGLNNPIYNGNEFKLFAKKFDWKEKKKLYFLLNNILNLICKKNYAGILGVDVKWDIKKEEFKILEVNARMQGSTLKQNRLELNNKTNPMSKKFYEDSINNCI